MESALTSWMSDDSDRDMSSSWVFSKLAKLYLLSRYQLKPQHVKFRYVRSFSLAISATHAAQLSIVAQDLVDRVFVLIQNQAQLFLLSFHIVERARDLLLCGFSRLQSAVQFADLFHKIPSSVSAL